MKTTKCCLEFLIAVLALVLVRSTAPAAEGTVLAAPGGTPFAANLPMGTAILSAALVGQQPGLQGDGSDSAKALRRLIP